MFYLGELYTLVSFIAPCIFRPGICDEFVEEFDDDSSDPGDTFVIKHTFYLQSVEDSHVTSGILF